MLIIGITGTLGAGKGTIVEFLVREKGFNHFSVRHLLTREIKKRKLPVNRDSMVEVANDLRKKFGSSFLAESLYQQAKAAGGNCVIESLRTPGEITALRKMGPFRLFSVDADVKLRYKRILKRKSETDKVSLEEFMKAEEKEMRSNDPNKQNLKKCIEMADYKFDNNSTVESLFSQVRKALNEIQEN